MRFSVFLNTGVNLLQALETVSHGCCISAHLHSALLALALNSINVGRVPSGFSNL